MITNLNQFRKHKLNEAKKSAWTIIDKVMNKLLTDKDNSAAKEENGDDLNDIVVDDLKLVDFIGVWDVYTASEDFGYDWDDADNLTTEIIAQVFGKSEHILSDTDFAVSGAEMREAYKGETMYWIKHDWDGTTLYIHKNDLAKFKELAKSVTINQD